MNKVFIDSDILIDYSKGYSQELDKFIKDQEKGNIQLYINPVVITEFFTDKNLRNLKKFEIAIEFISIFNQVDITKNIGMLAGKLLRENQTSYLGDALVAATCINHDFLLVTGNTKHFKNIGELKFAQPTGVVKILKKISGKT
ncbi:hypothetical protein A3D78_03790 [Candidatus Gottesmanbacteria bacterium RIFCSPHIGHO2_02_FULL_39_14]|uniref:PIN domain-containing protein n=1 Tax=Candidatus Gottesmanbacteria bacterium RIFCSPHIGHO2_02_FULL_39_14 TaxID=1798383 RepID=A0A1F5ZXJ4_9BACT|nr:MAG: hypothetical protein A3D78_03790 [Candidatus Gottesmanbacteria bacterium RIFCSPHIGHO2_02_FULL_39_14]